MFTVYQPKKIKKGKWILQDPNCSNSQIGFFKSRNAAEQHVIKTMSAIINR